MWHCCPRCLIAHADDSETPFSQRQDMQGSGTNWTWTVTGIEHKYGFVVRIHGTGITHAALTLRPVYYDTPQDTFTVRWGGESANEMAFLWIGVSGSEAPIAALPLSSLPWAYHVEIGFGWRIQGQNIAVAYARFYGENGNLITEAKAPIILTTAALKWRLDEVSFAGGTRVEIFGVAGPDEPCCLVLPAVDCSRIDYRGAITNLNYLPFVATMLPQWISNRPIVRASARWVVRTALGANLYTSVSFGDCCAANKFSVVFEAAAAKAYLMFECGYGGQVAEVSLPGLAQWDNNHGDADYHFEVCVKQFFWADEYGNQYYKTQVGVRASASYGPGDAGVMEDGWLIIDGTACLYDFGGLQNFMWAPVVGEFFTIGRLVSAYADLCYCQAPEAPALPNECINSICTADYWPEHDPHPPDYWLLSFSSLPGPFGAIAPYAPLGLTECVGLVTTETTSADGNALSPGIYSVPQMAGLVRQWIETYYGIYGHKLVTCDVHTCRSENAGDYSWIVSWDSWLSVPTSLMPLLWSINRIPLWLDVTFTLQVRLENHRYCVISRRMLFGAESPFPNCFDSVSFHLLWAGPVRRQCFNSALQSITCDECDEWEFPNFDQLTPVLIPIFE
ncbi:hypothetical protein [Thermogutta sp.]|uniref:hypothetical protein n=1 Tax=Thermogutta sp. TaxID=1962930 RepID=UPI0032202231